jgi:hypothetical protein
MPIIYVPIEGISMLVRAHWFHFDESDGIHPSREHWFRQPESKSPSH